MAATQGWFSSGIPSAYSGLRYDYEPESEAVWKDTMDRIREGTAQQVTNRGLGVGRGAYASLVSRGVKDAAVSRAKNEQEQKRLWSQQQAQIPVQPSTFGQVLAPVGQGLMYDLALRGPGSMLGKGVTGAMGGLAGAAKASSLLPSVGASAADYSNAYNSLLSGGESPVGWLQGDVTPQNYVEPSTLIDYTQTFAPSDYVGMGSTAPASESGSALGDMLSKAWGGITSLFGW